MNGTIAYALSRKYTEQSLQGVGALKGKNATISSITTIDGGSQITFAYTLDDSTQQTSTLDVLDAYGVALKNGFVGTEAEWLESLKMDATELQSVVQQEVADQIGTTVDERVEEKVTEQIEVQLDTTIQDKVDQAIEEALGSTGDSSEIEDEIDSWF